MSGERLPVKIKHVYNSNYNNTDFGYDSLGNNNTVSVGNQNLITNSYEKVTDANSKQRNTGLLLSSQYGNGQTVSNNYDTLNWVVGKNYNGTRYTYEYDASGNIGYQKDIINGVNYRYVYDISNRLVQQKDSLGNVIDFSYDGNSNTSTISDKVNGSTYSTSYGYDKDNKLNSITYNRATVNSVSLGYDSLARLTGKTINTGSASYVTSYGYVSGANGSSTNKIGTITNNGAAITYTYDANGNIDTITQDGQPIKYYYNELNEVTREDNKVLGKTITYSYDAGGNIKSKIEYPYTTGILGTATLTVNYTYGDSNWKDKLTAYNGVTITYDAIGNPLTHNGWTYSWEQGRQLLSLSNASNTISYKYNDSGIRTQKTVNGVTTKYHLVGDKVTYEDNGTDKMYYTYDSAGHLVSMSLNGVEYYYIRNAQGDIIGLFDKTGAQVVSYIYDSWGKLISTTGTLASTVGVKNPYRYRAYRYDTESGLYYLQSRYYSPDWGRFINADGLIGQTGELLGHNLFAYCKNNPVNRQDPSGFRTLKNDFSDPDEENIDPPTSSNSSNLTDIGQKGLQMKEEASEVKNNVFPIAKEKLQEKDNKLLTQFSVTLAGSLASYSLSKVNIKGWKFTDMGSFWIGVGMGFTIIVTDIYVLNDNINAYVMSAYILAENGVKYEVGDILYRFDKATLNQNSFKGLHPRGVDY